MNNEDNIKPNEWINQRSRFLPPKKSLVPKIDEIVSKIVGKPVFLMDPRLMALVVKWKKAKSPESMEPDNFLENPRFIEELRQTFK